MSRCKACGAAMTWAVHEVTGKRMPFDDAPDPLGQWIIEPDGVARYARPEDAPGDRYTSHHATCPNASEFRSQGSLL